MTITDSKTIGVLTSGGDCAGLNAVIRAVVRRVIQSHGWRVMGIHNGTLGLLQSPPEAEELTLDLFSGTLLRQGGTILGTTSSRDPFAFPMDDGSILDRSDECIRAYHALGLDGLIGIGGDGSLALLDRLTRQGDIPFVAVPKTIDNDVPGTEFAAGFSTAVETAVEALDRLQPTAASHHRVMVLEVMGWDAGHIALHAGISAAADVILIPEIPYCMEAVAEKIRGLKDEGRNHALVVSAEAAHPVGGEGETGGAGQEVGQKIRELTGAEVRVTVLGHIQRAAPLRRWTALRRLLSACARRICWRAAPRARWSPGAAGVWKKCHWLRSSGGPMGWRWAIRCWPRCGVWGFALAIRGGLAHSTP